MENLSSEYYSCLEREEMWKFQSSS